MKIVLSDNAPEGQPLAGSFGSLSFDAGNAKSFETDDMALAVEADRHPYFDVEWDGGGATKTALQAQAKEYESLRKAQEEVAEYNATKEIWEDPKLAPRTLEDLETGKVSAAKGPTNEAPAPEAKESK